MNLIANKRLVKLTLQLVCWLAFLAGRINADLFTSMGQMTRLVEAQVYVTQYLKNLIDFQSERLNETKLLLQDFDFIAQNAEKDPENFIGNPINALLLIKKLTKDFQNIADLLKSYSNIKLDEIRQTVILPSDTDYTGSIEAIHRLEETYLLEPSELAKGNLGRIHRSRPLNAFECFELGRVAYENEQYFNSVRWMRVALERVENEGDMPTVPVFNVLDYLAISLARQKKFQEALEITKRLLEIEPDHGRIRRNLEFYQDEIQRLSNGITNSATDINSPMTDFNNERSEKSLFDERESYKALCRGESINMPIEKLSKLTCRYINYHPLLVIAPVKEELVFDDPPIWIYHDVITEKQIEIMKTLAFPKLRRAIIQSPITGKNEIAKYRISQSGWLKDHEHPTLSYLSKLVTAITNLTMHTAEEWQIANYGLGGQYEPHFDFARKTDPGGFDPSEGNRVATWLSYLESPEIGGATVFTDIGAHVKPIRRSAAFWYNLLPSGNGDKRTRHAACPVLLGSKWVSNKWIHLVGQEFTRPCDLEKEPVPDF